MITLKQLPSMRSNCESWERTFLSGINCRGQHNSRRYFIKWHEVVHRLVEGEQLRFAFRHTPLHEIRKVPEKVPEEVLIDQIAVTLAFFPGIFKPTFLQEYGRAGKLNFPVVDRIREIVVPDASLQATMLACIKSVPVRCGISLAAWTTRGDAQQFTTIQGQLVPNQGLQPKPKSRAE